MLRGTGGALIIAWALEGLGERDPDCGDGPREHPCKDDSNEGLIVPGVLLLAAGTVYSLVDTHYAVRRYSRRNSFKAGFTPSLSLGREKAPRIGAIAWMRF